MMIVLGLLAKHIHLRNAILPAELSQRLDFANARIAAFTGSAAFDLLIGNDSET
jgi:hypothetical protein